MPSFSETLRMVFEVDTKAGLQEIRKIGDETEKSAGKAESAIQKFSASALKIGGAGMALGGFLTAMAAGDIQAEQQLKAAIENTGQSYDELEGRITAAAQSAVKFGITDEEVNGALTKLTLATHDTTIALDEMQLVENLAAQRHISLADAATIVAKIHGGSTKILKEYGIVVGQNADGTKNLTGAISELTAITNGQADAAADTWTGKLAALRAEIENQVSAFGQQYGPTILGVSTVLSGLAGVTEVVSAGMKRVKDSGSSMSSVLGKAGIAAAAVAATAGLIEYGRSLNKTSLDQGDFNKILTQSQDEANKTIDRLRQLSSGAFSDMGKVLEHLADQGQAGIGTLVEYRNHLIETGQSTEEVDKVLAEAADKQENLNQKTNDGTQANKDAAYSMEQMYAAMKKLDDERTAALGIVGGVKEAEIANTEAILDTRAKLDDLTKTQKDHKATLVDQVKATDDAKTAILHQADATGELAAKTAELNGVTDTANARQRAMVGALTTLRDSLAPGSDLYNYIQGYILQLLSIPTSINTTVRVTTKDGSTFANFGGGQGARAGGGPVTGGSTYLVGEEGPELFMPLSSGSIIPNNRLRSSAGSGSSTGNASGNTYITINALDPHSAARAVRDVIASDTRRNGNALAKSISR